MFPAHLGREVHHRSMLAQMTESLYKKWISVSQVDNICTKHQVPVGGEVLLILTPGERGNGGLAGGPAPWRCVVGYIDLELWYSKRQICDGYISSCRIEQ